MAEIEVYDQFSEEEPDKKPEISHGCESRMNTLHATTIGKWLKAAEMDPRNYESPKYPELIVRIERRLRQRTLDYYWLDGYEYKTSTKGSKRWDIVKIGRSAKEAVGHLLTVVADKAGWLWEKTSFWA